MFPKYEMRGRGLLRVVTTLPPLSTLEGMSGSTESWAKPLLKLRG